MTSVKIKGFLVECLPHYWKIWHQRIFLWYRPCVAELILKQFVSIEKLCGTDKYSVSTFALAFEISIYFTEGFKN